MRNQSRRKETIPFRKTAAALETDWLQSRIKADGTIEGVKIRFYPGVAKSLQINVYLEIKGEVPVSLFTFPSSTDQYITGDDDYFIFPVNVPVTYDDHIKVWYNNTDPALTRTVSVDVDVDYLNGQQRAGGAY